MGNMVTNVYAKSNYDQLHNDKALGFWIAEVSIGGPFHVQKCFQLAMISDNVREI